MRSPPPAWPRSSNAEDNHERWVRRALFFLEADLRERSLAALGQWTALELFVPSKDLLLALAGLNQGAWGSWNELLLKLRQTRQRVLRDGPADARLKVEPAARLEELVSFGEQRAPDALTAELGPLLKLCNRSVGRRPPLREIFGLPIVLRNRISHGLQVLQVDWWRDAAESLRPLVTFVAEHAGTVQPTDRLAPWFVQRDGRWWAFERMSQFKARYFAEGKEPWESEEGGRQILQVLQALSGKKDVQARDFRRLLGKLAPDELKGVLLDDFLVGRVIGEGGFARVHEAIQLSTGRKVAVKILRDGLEMEAQKRFQTEVESLADCHHENTVTVYGHNTTVWLPPRELSLQGEPWYELFTQGAAQKTYVALERIFGRTLEEVLRDSEEGEKTADEPARQPRSPDTPLRPDPVTLTDWFRQAAEALATVHERGWIHRDVKPSNLMVTDEGTIKLMDFGIARNQSEYRTQCTATGFVIGTPAYISPEQLQAEMSDDAVGPLTDVYSLCATFYELYTGHQVYEPDPRGARSALEQKRAGERPKRARDWNRSLDADLDALLTGGITPEIDVRPQSMRDLADDLHRIQEQRPIRFAPPSIARRLRLGYRRHRTMSNVVTLFLLAGLISTGFYVYSVNRARRQAEAQRQRADLQRLGAEQQRRRAEREKQRAEREKQGAESSRKREMRERQRAQRQAKLLEQRLQIIRQERAAKVTASRERDTARSGLRVANSKLRVTLAKSQGETRKSQEATKRAQKLLLENRKLVRMLREALRKERNRRRAAERRRKLVEPPPR